MRDMPPKDPEELERWLADKYYPKKVLAVVAGVCLVLGLLSCLVSAVGKMFFNQ